MGSEYVVMYMNISNWPKISNMPESAEIYPNMGKYTSIWYVLEISQNLQENSCARVSFLIKLET